MTPQQALRTIIIINFYKKHFSNFDGQILRETLFRIFFELTDTSTQNAEAFFVRLKYNLIITPTAKRGIFNFNQENYDNLLKKVSKKDLQLANECLKNFEEKTKGIEW